jgi:hypothetical protein
MTHPIPARFALCAAATALLLCGGGCYHEHYTYRAISNVNLAYTHELGSQGPLQLVSLDDQAAAMAAEQPRRASGARMIESLTAEQIARFDPSMAELLRRARDARETLRQAQQKNGPDDPKTRQARADSDSLQASVDEYVREFKAQNRDKVLPAGGGAPVAAAEPAKPPPPKSLLVGSVEKTFGDKGSTVVRTFVLMIDGAPRPGTYWLTPDNSVLITYSYWSPPSRTRIGLTGSVEIFSVNGNKIDAQVTLRETTEVDTAEFVSDYHYLDPAYYQTPWVINGRHTFLITTKDDPAFEKAAVHWVKADE